MFIKKYLKWISTALVLTGILLTNLKLQISYIFIFTLIKNMTDPFKGC